MVCERKEIVVPGRHVLTGGVRSEGVIALAQLKSPDLLRRAKPSAGVEATRTLVGCGDVELNALVPVLPRPLHGRIKQLPGYRPAPRPWVDIERDQFGPPPVLEQA